MVLGKKKSKFDARIGPGPGQEDLFQSPQAYTFIHNFKVHYKRGVLQALANKTDVSINSSSPQLPDMQLVTDEFNRRMTATVVVSNTRRRYAEVSFHITNVEYKESFAIPRPVGYNQSSPAPSAASVPGTTQSGPQDLSIFCRSCGNRLPSDSKFCNKCGLPVV